MKLSPRVVECVKVLFASDAPQARRILEAANVHDDSERYALAAVRVSGGNLERLRSALADDLRDTLMGAGFGDLQAHKSWQPKVLTGSIAEAWALGQPVEGVRFRPGETAYVCVPDPRSNKKVIIQRLVTLEPRPLYGVTQEDGSAATYYESWLRAG